MKFLGDIMRNEGIDNVTLTLDTEVKRLREKQGIST